MPVSKIIKMIDAALSAKPPYGFLAKTAFFFIAILSPLLAVCGMIVSNNYIRFTLIGAAFLMSVSSFLLLYLFIKRYAEMNKKMHIFEHISLIDIHKMRSSLSVQLEGIKMILEGIAGELKPKQRALLEISKKGAERINQFLNDIFSKAEK